LPGDQRIVIRAVGWNVYETVIDAIGEGPHVRLAYDGRGLEIMTKGRIHQDYSELVGRLVDVITEELDIACSGAGETSRKRLEIARGLEADQCYYFQPEKLAADIMARDRKSNNVADYPNPDLAIEIDISTSEIDRPGIYAALEVAEVWRFDGEALVIEQLQENGAFT
jgi:Uma2 family endonuclease